MSADILWQHEDPVRDLGIAVPRWIDQDIDGATVAAIIQGGCASGAYMPAVTYHEALATMNDAVMDYIEGALGYVPMPTPDASTSWAALACFYLSIAVELWAASVEEEVREALEKEAGA